MSMNDDVDAVTPAPQPGALPQFVTPIVPRSTIAGRALVAIVAIMTFLASLTTGAVVLVRAAASDWQSEVAREVTIQVRPVGNRDLEADVGRAADIARRFPGVADVRIYSKEESSHLLEPWLGTGLVLDELPVPRLAVVRITSGAAPEFVRLGKLLTEQVPSASQRMEKARMRAGLGLPTAADIAPVVLFLCGGGARRITGQVISISGGFSML